MLVVAALYQFVDLPDYKRVRDALEGLCKSAGIKGTLLLAPEGINGTVAGSRQAIDQLKAFLNEDGRFNDLEYKESFAEKMPFLRLRVRLKKEIVTLADPRVNPNQVVGTYVAPKDWNDLIAQEDVIVLDTRNDYEVNIGTFKNAVDPKTKTFTEFKDFVRKNYDPKQHRRVAMFCTGGIRCEKASSFMKLEGFEEVYHLKGGILKYLEEVPAEESLWQGDCFVFDDRVAVGHGLELTDYQLCRGCRYPLSLEDRESPQYVEGVQCAYCVNERTEEQRKRYQDRQNQIKLAAARGERHMGSK